MRLIVNGATHDVTAPAHETLLSTLRDRLELTGTKLVCGRGECGSCTPGQILAAVALLKENPNPTEDAVRRGMSGNLCRCGAYPKILRAVLAAASQDTAPDTTQDAAHD